MMPTGSLPRCWASKTGNFVMPLTSGAGAIAATILLFCLGGINHSGPAMRFASALAQAYLVVLRHMFIGGITHSGPAMCFASVLLRRIFG